VSRVHFELFAEATLELEPVFQLEDLSAVDVAKTPEAGVLTRPSLLGNAVVCEAQVMALVIDVDG
jgi:hypothetical protein